MTEFNFGTSEETIQDQSGAPQVNNPAIGKVKLNSVHKTTIKKSDGTEFPNVLVFEWKFMPGAQDIVGNDIAGFTAQKLEWEPREEDDQEKVNNKTGRTGYVMAKYLGEEKAIIDPSNIKSWEHFVDTVVKRFEATPEAFEKVMKLKAPANKWQGKLNIEIPNYKGFLQSSKKDNALAFSKKEEQVNAEYLASKNLAADAPPEAGGSDLSEEELF